MSLSELTLVIPQAEGAAIEYPAFVRNTGKALHTLGGDDDIAAAVSSKQRYLKLKLRPEDRTSHPLYGERLENTRLLLRIARRKDPPSDVRVAAGATSNDALGPSDMETDAQPQPTTSEAPSSNTAPAAEATDGPADAATDVTANLVARVNTTFRFPGLADYAFLPHDPLLPSRARDSLPYDQRPDRSEPTKVAQPFLLIPQLFSWLDLPQDYAFKQLQSKHAPRVAGRSDPNWGDAPVISFYAEGVPPPVISAASAAAAAPTTATASVAAEGPAAATAAAADGAAGAEPSTGDPVAAAAAAAGIADVRAYRVLEAEVSRLLGQRPVWGLELVRERCVSCPAVLTVMPGGCSPAAVERVVQRLCYRFKTGPWRGLFIRRGYDPRADMEARKYQAIIYSLPNNWYRGMLKTGSRNVTHHRKAAAAAGSGSGTAAAAGAASPGAAAPAAAAAGTAPASAAGGDGADAASAGAGRDAGSAPGAAAPAPAVTLAPTSLEDLHNFRVLPTQQSSTFQLVDLQLKEVQDVLLEPPAPGEAIRCSEKTGWFANATLQQMQNAVQQRFLQLMDQLAPPGTAPSAATAKEFEAAGTKSAGKAAANGAAAAPDPGVAGAGAGAAAVPAVGGGGCGDIDMADADAAKASGGAGDANEVLRELMATMNLRGLTAAAGVAAGADGGGAAGGGGDCETDLADGLAGLFGSDDEDDDYRLLGGQEGAAAGQEGEEEGSEGVEEGEEEEGEEGDEEGGTPRRRRRRRRQRNGAAGRVPATAEAVGRGADGDDGDAAAGGEGSEGYESMMESEYDVGMTGDEDDDEDDDAGTGLGRGGIGGGGLYGDAAYGRITVPYDGDVTVQFGMHGMFGSDDEDDPY